MAQFITYLHGEHNAIHIDFLLQFERSVIKFNKSRQRVPSKRDNFLLTGAFVICKVLVKRLLFKPYKINEFLDSVTGNFPKSKVFKDNCIVLGYTFIALLTDYLLDLYWTRIEKVAGKPLVHKSDIDKVKDNIFR